MLPLSSLCSVALLTARAPLVALSDAIVQEHRLAYARPSTAAADKHARAIATVGDHADFARQQCERLSADRRRPLLFLRMGETNRVALVSAHTIGDEPNLPLQVGETTRTIRAMSGLVLPHSQRMPGGKHPAHWFIATILSPWRVVDGGRGLRWFALPQSVLSCISEMDSRAELAPEGDLAFQLRFQLAFVAAENSWRTAERTADTELFLCETDTDTIAHRQIRYTHRLPRN